MTIGGLIDELLFERLEIAAPGAVERDVDLAALSRWRIGGRAAIMVEPGSADEVAAVARLMAQSEAPFLVVGGTSNVLFDTAGFDGVLMKIGPKLSGLTIEGETATVEAGMAVPDLAWELGRRGLRGIEHTVGIPGTIGGLVMMNGGSQRKGVGDHVASVLCADMRGEVFRLTGEECEFSYRGSSLQHRDCIVLSVTLRLEQGDADASVREMNDIIQERAAKFPSDVPSCGSTFLSNPSMYQTVGAPGHAIEAVGLKGLRRGDAQISPRHANFFVNNGRATSDDVLWLIAVARNTVEDVTGYLIDCEVRYVSPAGAVVPAHVAASARWGGTLSTTLASG